jgi:hypothetical protein
MRPFALYLDCFEVEVERRKRPASLGALLNPLRSGLVLCTLNTEAELEDVPIALALKVALRRLKDNTHKELTVYSCRF